MPGVCTQPSATQCWVVHATCMSSLVCTHTGVLVCLYATRNVQDLKTTDLGMGNVRLKAEVDFDGRQIGSDTLKSYHNVDEMFEVRH